MATPVTSGTSRPRAIRVVIGATRDAVRRFPLVVAAGVTAAVAAGIAIGEGRHPEAIRLAVTAVLALPLVFAVTVLREQWRQPAIRWMLLAIALIALAGFWWAWPGWTLQGRVYRTLQLSVAFHTFAAFSPFVRRGATNGFWQYNKTLLFRFVTAAIHAGVLYAGLAIALLAIDKLFGIAVLPRTYARLWFALTLVFGTAFFVGGTPEDVEALEQESEYPNALRAFTQFVLVPLVAIYLVILMLYLAKVLVTREWPSGWIGYLVSSVSALGILAWLLVYPLEEGAAYRWVKPFTRGFYVALMPAIVMLWLATWQRVNQYGITEPRYFLIVLSIWLAGVALYYTLSNSRNITLIPASLCVLALVTSAGPAGAYAVSRGSQLGRLRAVLERNALLVDGRLRPSAGTVPDSDRTAISAELLYLLDSHGDGSVSGWLPDSLRRAFAARHATPSGAVVTAEADAQAIMTGMHLAYELPVRRASAVGGGITIFFSTPGPPRAIPIAGYTHALNLVALRPGLDSIVVDPRTILTITKDDAVLHVVRDGVSLLDLPLQAAIDSASATPRATRPLLRIEGNNGDVAIVLYITGASGVLRNGRLALATLSAWAFARLP